MGKTRSTSIECSVADEEHQSRSMTALMFLDLLNDEQVLQKLKQILFPQALADTIDSMTVHITNLSTLLKNKDTRINELEQKVHTLESAIDSQEQYSRRQNLRINGIPETGDTEDITTAVLNLVNHTMAIKPQLQRHAIVKCHRLGPKVDRRGDQQTRPIIVKFTNESIRDDVLRARFVLKEHNAKHSDSRIFLNEDLTGIRAKLAREARVLKKSGKIDDTWTFNGNVMIKDVAHKICPIRSAADIERFR